MTALRSGIEIFVGTTGRVLDHIERGNIDFSSIKSVILDEADQMLKLGFKEDVEKVRPLLLINFHLDPKYHQGAMPFRHPDMSLFSNHPSLGAINC
jgi:hypothetical protein